jgi:hypothetical protein
LVTATSCLTSCRTNREDSVGAHATGPPTFIYFPEHSSLISSYFSTMADLPPETGFSQRNDFKDTWNLRRISNSTIDHSPNLFGGAVNVFFKYFYYYDVLHTHYMFRPLIRKELFFLQRICCSCLGYQRIKLRR